MMFMTRKILFTGVIAAATAGGLLIWNGGANSRLAEQVDRLERERERLVTFAQRLVADRRVGQINVLGTRINAEGRPVTRLIWQEIGPNEVLSLPVEREVVGTFVYVEAFVVKFEHEWVGEGDKRRGTSVALFRRLFGDGQTPESAPMLDGAAGMVPPAGPPMVPYGSPPRRAGDDGVAEPALAWESEQDLWERFWQLVDDPVMAKAYGVRVAQIEAPAVPVRAGEVWQVTLDAAGGLNVRKVRAANAPTALNDPLARDGMTDEHP